MADTLTHSASPFCKHELEIWGPHYTDQSMRLPRPHCMISVLILSAPSLSLSLFLGMGHAASLVSFQHEMGGAHTTKEER